ncbi:MAG: aminopeptidase [Thermoanaerobaculia bacterium]|nr:aminopeptidase [Thermoanaerobaculia bacterium]
MADPRYDQLADVLVGYSCALQPGEKILIESIDAPHAFTRALIRRVHAAGGVPLVTLKSNVVFRELMLAASEEQMRLIGEAELVRMKNVDAYVGVRCWENVSEWSDIPPDKLKLYQRHYYQPVHLDRRVRNTRWVVLRWPNPAMAQLASMSTEAFEDFYFRVCTLDYAHMSAALQPLRELMDRTDRVRLVAPDTDLRFSIRGIPAVPCDGHRNIPDGEVYTAPVLDSVEGKIRFNSVSVYQGGTHDDIRLEVRGGKIVAATSSDTPRLNHVLDTDAGSRSFGEFAIGFNPHVTRPMKDILFDEKIAGSIHLAVGNCYDEAPNGNKSQIHWDMVLRMDLAAGGGEVWFDDVLIRKDGRFVIRELEGLNPERLTG